MDISDTSHNAVGAVDGKQAVCHFFRLRAERVLAVEDIERDDDADQDIEQHGNRGHDACHQFDQLRQSNILHPVDDLLGKLAVDLQEVAFDHRIVLQKRRHPAGDLIEVIVHGFEQGKDADDQLRQYHPQQDADDRNTDRQGKDAAKTFGNPRAVFQSLRQAGLNAFVQSVEDGHQQVGHDKPIDKRAEDAQ